MEREKGDVGNALEKKKKNAGEPFIRDPRVDIWQGSEYASGASFV